MRAQGLGMKLKWAVGLENMRLLTPVGLYAPRLGTNYLEL